MLQQPGNKVTAEPAAYAKRDAAALRKRHPLAHGSSAAWQYRETRTPALQQAVRGMSARYATAPRHSMERRRTRQAASVNAHGTRTSSCQSTASGARRAARTSVAPALIGTRPRKQTRARCVPFYAARRHTPDFRRKPSCQFSAALPAAG